MRRVGPQPPDPDWDRLDFRNPNGSRQAWGYLDPTDMVIVTNDGEFSKFYIGYSSKDTKGLPQPAKAQDASPGRSPSHVKTEMEAGVLVGV